MKLSKRLKEYIALRKNRAFGWRKQFEESWAPQRDDLNKWIELSALYSVMLDELIDSRDSAK